MARYVVVTDPQNGSKDGKVLFLVKQKEKGWWTFDLSKAAFFTDEYAARDKVKALKYGNPRIMKMSDAREMVKTWDMRDGIH